MLTSSIDSSFALRIEGIDLWRPLSATDADELSRLLSTHGVLVFPRQAIGPAELAEVSARFGELDIIVRTDWQSPVQQEVVVISNMKDAAGESIGGLGSGELSWHSDQSYMAHPATGSGLYMVEPPRTPTRTQWCNLMRAYAELPRALEEKVRDCEGIFDYLKRQSTYDDEAPMSSELRNKTPLVSHPLVNIHPLTRTPSLYLDPTTTVGIVGMDKDEGRQLLDELEHWATQPQFVYTHEWEVGDVVFWDNGFMLHRRDDFPENENRLLLRTTFRPPPERHLVPTGLEL